MAHLDYWAFRLGGDVDRGRRQVLCPGPGHDPKDRSLSVTPADDPDLQFVTFSFAGDPVSLCRDMVTAKLGVGGPLLVPRREPQRKQDDRERVSWLWRQRQPIVEAMPPYTKGETPGLCRRGPDDPARLPRRRQARPAEAARIIRRLVRSRARRAAVARSRRSGRDNGRNSRGRSETVANAGGRRLVARGVRA